MPSSYTNITLKGPEQTSIVHFLKRAGRRAYVSPTHNGRTVVFDEASEGQDTEVIGTAAGDLSREFNCPALAVVNHEDQVLLYQLYIAGEIADEYLSAPDAFEMDEEEAAEVAGDAEKLCEAFGATGREDAVNTVLAERSKYSAEYERHKDLTDLLTLPRIAVNLGYNYIAGSKVTERIEKAGLVLVQAV